MTQSKQATVRTNNALLDTADLGLNLDRALSAVRGLRGGAARILGLVFVAIVLALLPFVWYFDVEPTVDWLNTASAPALASLPAALALLAPAIGILINFLPTLFEFALPRLAAAGVRVAALLSYGAALFDATTDWPRVAQTMDAGWERFATFGQLAAPLWYLARVGLLFLATLGFELAITLCAACAVVLLLNSFKPGGQP
jgi:hypothetical protein